MSWASPISVHVGVPFGRSVFVVFAATPTFATKAVPSVALVAFLGWRSPFRSTLIEMPHAAHPIVSVFFNFAFLPTTLTRIACLLSRCSIRFGIERALRVCCLTALIAVRLVVHEALPNNSYCVQTTLLFVSRVIASVP